MKIVYYTSAKTGSGHVVLGISIYNGLKRTGIDCTYTILTSGPFTDLAKRAGVVLEPIVSEDENQLDKIRYKTSALYRKLKELDPDILLVDLSWFTLHYFIDELPCKKVFLCRQVSDGAFRIPVKNGPLVFNPDSYTRIFAIEPFSSRIEMERINPIVIRNKNEILSRESARTRLGVDTSRTDQPLCLFNFNGKPGEYAHAKKMYSYLEEEGYKMVYTTNFKHGLFPTVDYFNAVDLLICGAGYNAFWEAVYFQKETIFVPFHRRFENQRLRVQMCEEYPVTENGADQLAEKLLHL